MAAIASLLPYLPIAVQAAEGLLDSIEAFNTNTTSGTATPGQLSTLSADLQTALDAHNNLQTEIANVQSATPTTVPPPAPPTT